MEYAGVSGGRRGLVRRAAVLSAIVGGVLPVHAARTLAQPCTHVVASPAFVRDGTAFCAGTPLGGGPPGIVVTSDRGQTWRRASATGLPYKAGDVVDDLAISPRFEQDGMVFVSVRFEGVFVSTDLGSTFSVVIPYTTPVIHPFAADAGGLGAGLGPADRTLLLVPRWLGEQPAVIDPLSRTVTPGTTPAGPAVGALVSPAWTRDHTAMLFTQSGSLRDTRVRAYGCSAAFTCDTELGSFPAGLAFGQAWAAADFGTSRTIFVRLAETATGRPHLYVSRDGGRRFSPMTAANAILRAHAPDARRDHPAVVTLAPGASGSTTLWLRVYGAPYGSSVPGVELYRSGDNGRSWRRVAFGRLSAPGPRGTMTDLRIAVHSTQSRALLAVTADGHVFLNGIAKGGWTAHCSTDAGRTWAAFCGP